MTYSDFDIQSPDGTRLSGRTWTAENPAAVVNIIHGLGEHSGRYAHMAGYLNDRNISVYAIDLHGHGRTPGKRGIAAGVAAMMEDVNALFDFSHMQNPNRPHILMGHSMGGNIVLSYGLDYPDSDYKAIIAQAPLIEPATPVPAFMQYIVRAVSKISPDFAIKSKLEKEKITTLAEQQDLYINDPLNHGYLGGRMAISLFEKCKAIQNNAADYPYDVLVTHGTQDRLTDYEASKTFAAGCPRADFISYPDSGHEVHNDLHRDQVYADLVDWILKRV